MSDFKKGQLVAVRDADGQEWSLRVYDHASPEGQHFCRGIERRTPPCWWSQVESAEVIWPDIFLADDRRAVEVLRKECDRMKARAEEAEDGLTTAYLAGFTDGEQSRQEKARKAKEATHG